jgi:F-type H+-transporting ATPase subunit delta
MGSATREALASARAALAALAGRNGLATGEQLFRAARVIGDSAALRSALADPSSGAADKTALVDRVFSSIDADSRALLSTIVGQRWSSQDELLEGIEEIGIRAVASSAPKGTSIEHELFAFGSAVSSNAGLELAVGSKLGTAAAKSALVSALLAGKASAQTLAIVDHVVQQPRGRRIGELVRHASALVADEAGMVVATVVSAVSLSAAQQQRLIAGLAATRGRDIQLNLVVDPTIVGGLRVQIGDDVIDGSISTRLTGLRLQLA